MQPYAHCFVSDCCRAIDCLTRVPAIRNNRLAHTHACMKHKHKERHTRHHTNRSSRNNAGGKCGRHEIKHECITCRDVMFPLRIASIVAKCFASFPAVSSPRNRGSLGCGAFRPRKTSVRTRSTKRRSASAVLSSPTHSNTCKKRVRSAMSRLGER